MPGLESEEKAFWKSRKNRWFWGDIFSLSGCESLDLCLSEFVITTNNHFCSWKSCFLESYPQLLKRSTNTIIIPNIFFLRHPSFLRYAFSLDTTSVNPTLFNYRHVLNGLGLEDNDCENPNNDLKNKR